MGALSWLRFVRRVPGFGSQPELPNIESLIEEEALKTKDEFHLARWIVPLVTLIVGLSVFIPLTVTVSLYFLFGAIGLPVIGGILGVIFHFVARRIPPSKIKLRKRCHSLLSRLNGLKNILGFTPALSPQVAPVLEEAAGLFLRARLPETVATGDVDDLWAGAVARARAALDEAMGQMLALAEPETAAAQEAELARGWAQPLLEEMRATVQMIEEQRAKALVTGVGQAQLAPLAGLRDARQELVRLGDAVSELEREAQA